MRHRKNSVQGREIPAEIGPRQATRRAGGIPRTILSEPLARVTARAVPWAPAWLLAIFLALGMCLAFAGPWSLGPVCAWAGDTAVASPSISPSASPSDFGPADAPASIHAAPPVPIQAGPTPHPELSDSPTLVLEGSAVQTAPAGSVTHPVLADSPVPSPFTLQLPIRCEAPGCFIQNYFDHDPGPGFRDYACGYLGYDGHTGTDFRVTPAAMEAGVPVYAAAPGRVLATRDGEVDESLRDKGAGAVAGREAGNAVVVEHEGGWVTQYNHLKRGSVAVRKGDVVRAGTLLGMVGLSGRTEFPHLELEVRKDTTPVDPFVGAVEWSGCGPGPNPVWSQAALDTLGYTGGGPVSSGFSRAPPNLKGVYQWGESARVLPQDAPAIVLWAVVYGVRPGDKLVMTITDPRGGVFQQNTADIQRTQAQFVAFVGRKLGKAPWLPGEYTGHCLLLRGPELVLADMTARVEVQARSNAY